MTLTACAIAWKIRPASSFEEFVGHLHGLLAQCPDGSLAVLPEFFSLELLPFFGGDLVKLAAAFPEIVKAMERVAMDRGLVIVGGSHIANIGPQYQNISPLVRQAGIQLQAKLKLTQFEQQDMNISAGQGLREPIDQLSTLICYDSEFPEAGRILAEAGCRVLAVPAFTETVRGFQRVRWSCQARAIENQIFVIHSSLVGSLEVEPVPTTYGSSAILAPSVSPFAESAVLAETPLHKEGVAIATLDFDQLELARNSDDVRNWHDRDPSCWRIVPR
ncbi:MAG: hypothetical protein JNJ45_11790 [Chthonomonas sp.]|nr:hypothetical protein [Chthonomonas sp.]